MMLSSRRRSHPAQEMGRMSCTRPEASEPETDSGLDISSQQSKSETKRHPYQKPQAAKKLWTDLSKESQQALNELFNG